MAWLAASGVVWSPPTSSSAPEDGAAPPAGAIWYGLWACHALCSHSADLHARDTMDKSSLKNDVLCWRREVYRFW